MMLVDTSVWIDHWRRRDDALAYLLDAEQVLVHPFVMGELALGHLRDHVDSFNAMMDMPQAAVVHHDELLYFIKRETLAGLGIGYVDAHLLAAVRLTPGTSLWTRDRRLHGAAVKLGLASTGLPGMTLH
jgi:predicted nucleic acid-binding protein